LVDRGTSPVSLSAAIIGLDLFSEITADHAELTAMMQPVHVPRTPSVVLSREKVACLIIAAGNLKIRQRPRSPPGPAAVPVYLPRYTHRVAISNARLVAMDERGVTFR
jgi:hypothetical protein